MEDKDAIIFDGMSGLTEVVVTAPLLYILAVVGVRLSGKRTTRQMNNFDWIVTVAMGSIMASGIVIRSVSLIEALVAITILFVLQWCLTKVSVLSRAVDTAVKSTPRVLLAQGTILGEACRDERITREELVSALRAQGYGALDELAWVILENNGEISVVTKSTAKTADREVIPPKLRIHAKATPH